MTCLGQPVTQAELQAEQDQLAQWQSQRIVRDERIRREVADGLACGETYEYATATVARRHKLGRGAVAYVRRLTSSAGPT